MRSREDDDRMIHAAHASRFHWGEAPECKPENLARGDWQVSRVYRETANYKELAAEVPIADVADREHLAEDLATL